MDRCKKLFTVVVGTGTLGLGGFSAQAALIDFNGNNGPTSTIADASISTTSNNSAFTASVDLSGVEAGFGTLALDGDKSKNRSAAAAPGDTDVPFFQDFLGSAPGSGGDALFTMDFTGFSAGTYDVVVYLFDNNKAGDQNNVPVSLTDANGSGVALGNTFTAGAGSSAVSAFALSFTVDGTTPNAQLNLGDGSASNVLINGISIAGAPVTPVLSGFTYDAATGDCEVDIVGAANTAYKLVEAADLDFATPDQSKVPLDGATVGTVLNDEVTTDGSGNATVQFDLGTVKDATFIRAEEAP